jgi:N-acetylgalactosamine kinase
MAIHRNILAAYSALPEPSMEIVNADNKVYSGRSFVLNNAILPFPKGDWGNYPKAAAQGVVDLFRDRSQQASELRGARVMVWGDIPPAAGLASSSALVVVTALILLDVNDAVLGPSELALRLADAERYVGTQGGGMDQAVCLMARRECAMKIGFHPLSAEPIPIPAGYSFVAAHSMVTAPKSGKARDRYNLRAAECRMATALLKKTFSRALGRSLKVEEMADLNEANLGISAQRIQSQASEFLDRETYSSGVIASALGISREEVGVLYCCRKDGSKLPEPREGFRLRQRARHVLSEWRRVELGVEALETSDMVRFGGLMDESHRSCRTDMEVSCPELDRLTDIARKAGALGSRLTGAGFGGFTVSLVRTAEASRFRRMTIDRYYRKDMQAGEESLDDLIFSCRAEEGAGIIA